MRNLYFLLCLSVFTLFFSDLKSQCGNGRYYDKIFTTQTTADVLFGNAIKHDGTAQNLLMNIYRPQGDNLPDRPLIVLAFGGSFTFGFRTSPDIVYLCQEFSKRGYVCASIDYRLGFEDGNDSDTNQFKALIRGVQDMRAAVRFFYKDAQTADVYGIDTTRIFIGGVSAGGVIALNYAYGKDDTLSRSRPDWADSALAEVGGGIGNSGNPGYSDRVKGAINMSGAIADTVWVMPSDPVLCAVHGSEDDLVPCLFDSAQAQNSVEAMLFGSCDLETRATNVGLRHSIKIFNGAGHTPFILPCFLPQISPCKQYMDTTEWTIRDFLFEVVCDTFLSSAVEDISQQISVSVFPNPSDDAISISSNHNSDLMAEIFSIEGRLLQKKLIAANSIQTISKQELGAGTYLLQLSDLKSSAKKVERIVFY